jgi:hypothetical protein
VIGPDGKEKPNIIAFTEHQKPFILNAEMRDIVRQYCKSRYAEDWVNVPITFYVLENKKYFGKILDVLRIRIRQVGPKIDYTTQERMLKECKTLADLQTVYTSFTADQKAATLTTKDQMKNELSKN